MICVNNKKIESIKFIRLLNKQINYQSNMYDQTQTQPNSIDRLKQIQKSNYHVKNIIQSAKKMIYHRQQLSSDEKQVLEVISDLKKIKISIENDHLKNSFYKINSSEEDFMVEITQKKGSLMKAQEPEERGRIGSIRRQEVRIGQQNQIYQYDQVGKWFKNEDYPNSQRLEPDTKIKISRIVEQSTSQASQRNNNTLVTVHQNPLNSIKEQYQICMQQGNSINQSIKILPLKNSKVIVTTKTQPLSQITTINPTTKQKYLNNHYYSQYEEPTPTFSSYRKSRQHSQHLFSPDETKMQRSQCQPYEQPSYQQSISIQTPNNKMHIITTEAKQRVTMESIQPPQETIVSSDKKKRSPKTESFFFSNTVPTPLTHIQDGQEKKDISSQKHNDSQRSTSYKEILQKNKEKLNTPREKNMLGSNGNKTPKSSKSPHYELHLEELYKKKQQGKRRLYGNSPQPNQSLENSFVSKKYSIANSRSKKGQNDGESSRKVHETSIRSRSGSLNTSSLSTSQTKRKPLHTSTIKSIHEPCSTCSRCKATCSSSSPKESKQALGSFHLAKKYLTPEGQQECYNFLKSQGIAEKDWPIFVTEYVYRQLSKAYQYVSPSQHQKISQ